jgi:hypothetical protein
VDGATTYPSDPYGVAGADRVARRRGNGKPTDRTADGDHAGEGGKVVEPFSTSQNRRSAEGYSTSGQTRLVDGNGPALASGSRLNAPAAVHLTKTGQILWSTTWEKESGRFADAVSCSTSPFTLLEQDIDVVKRSVRSKLLLIDPKGT